MINLNTTGYWIGGFGTGESINQRPALLSTIIVRSSSILFMHLITSVVQHCLFITTVTRISVLLLYIIGILKSYGINSLCRKIYLKTSQDLYLGLNFQVPFPLVVYLCVNHWDYLVFCWCILTVFYHRGSVTGHCWRHWSIWLHVRYSSPLLFLAYFP